MDKDEHPQVQYVLVSPQNRQKELQNKTRAKKMTSSYYECVSCLDDVLFPRHRGLPPALMQRFNRLAIGLCLLTLSIAVVVTSLSYASFRKSKSSGVFAFAFDALLQALSSVMLIWRFSSSRSSISVGRKETIATLTVAFCNAASAILIIVPTVQLLLQREKPSHPKFSLIISSLGLLLYTMLFLTKYKVSRKLGSSALMTDAIDSLAGALMGLTILVSSLILVFTNRAWFLDAVTALGIASLMFIYAVTVIVEQIRLRKQREDDLNGCWVMFGSNSGEEETKECRTNGPRSRPDEK